MLNKSFILKHWGTTLAFAPFLPGLYELIISSERSWLEVIGLYPLFMIFGCLFSLPALLGYFLLFQSLAKAQLSILTKKLLLIGYTVLSIGVTCWLIKGSMMPVLSIAYSAAAIISGFVFRLQSDEEAQPTTSNF